jgi:hypothetical protein
MIKSYRVDNKYEFTLEFKDEEDGTYSLWGKRWPRNPHDTGQAVTHINEETGRICIAQGCEPRTLDKVIAIGQHWCKGYAHYIETGEFPNGKARINV